MKKIVLKLISVIIVTILLASSIIANAQDFYSGEIPSYMSPYTVIEYVDENNYVIKQGSLPSEEYDYSLVSNTNQLNSEECDSTYFEQMPTPVKGVIVTYASDGFIDDIIYPDGIQNPLLLPADLPVVANSTSKSSQMYLIARWGANSNELWGYTDNSSMRTGIGRATTFSDAIGQANIRNSKGSVATKLSVDNCPVWTKLTVQGPHKNGNFISVDMYKTDAGSMPNAVLDIWKTGVEYFGYTYSSSFSMPDNLMYTHY